MNRKLQLVSVCIFLFISKLFGQGAQTVNNGQQTTAINFPGTSCVYNWKNDSPQIGLAASGTGNIPSFAAVNTGTVPIIATITATPVPSGFAYIANEGDGTVSVINTLTNAVAATITVGAAPICVALNPDGSRVYVANSSDGTVSVINTATNAVVATIPVLPFDNNVVVSRDGSRVYATGQKGITVIDAATNKVITTINQSPDPFAIAVSPDGSRIYVTNDAKNTLMVINTATNTTTATINVGTQPSGIIISPDGNWLYVTNYSSNTVSVVSTASNSVVATVSVPPGPFGITISPDGGRVYAGSVESKTITVINTATNTVNAIIPSDTEPYGLSISPDGGSLYVADANINSVSVFNTTTKALISTIKVGVGPNSHGNFISGGIGCTPETYSITVNPNSGLTPLILTGPLSGAINACAGSASASPGIQQFTVSGSNLTSSITVAAPSGFEVSLSSGAGYGGNIMLSAAAGSVNTTVIYVRSAASAPAGQLSGSILLTSAGAASQNVTVTGTIAALPVVAFVPDQAVTAGSPTKAIVFSGSGNMYSWVNDTPGIGLAASGAGDIASFKAINKGSSPVTATITVTPTLSARAYVANYYGDDVSVIDVATGKVVTAVPVGGHPLGVSVSADGTRVYVANESDNTESVINTASNTVVATLPTDVDPGGTVVSPDGSRLYVSNGGSGTVSVIDIASKTIIKNIQVGTQPYGIAISPDGNYVYVSNFVSNSVSIISTSNNLAVAEIQVGQNPVGVAVSPDGTRLYVLNQKDGTVSVVNTITDAVAATFSEGAQPTGIAISPDGSKLYISDPFLGYVSVINTATNTKVAAIKVGTVPYGISRNGDGSVVYVANHDSNNVSVISTTTNLVVGTIPVDSDPFSLGNFINAGEGCPGASIKFTITVNPEPPSGITTSGTLSSLTTIYGTPSTSSVFSVAGSGLTEGILVTPPTGFEVSTNDITFTSSVTVGSGGGVPSTQVYIRLAATTAVGNYSRNIVLSSPGTSNVNVFMPLSSVTPAPLTITADNKSKSYGSINPVLTASYSGFVNNETFTDLTTQPVLATTAITTSPVGQYPITADGAASPNYMITFVQGVLTVVGTIVVPNTFTPNGDGVNDTWDIKFLDTYANCSVDIFSRYGQKVYSSIGYAIPWDGTYRRAALPAGTYYYIINLKNGAAPLSGFVAIIR